MQFISQLLEHPSLLAYFSGANNYTWLQFRNGERRLLAKPLTYFEERLPAFIRIHKTALINPACVANIQHPLRTKMPGTVQMIDGVELPVSRRRWSEVVQLLQNSVLDRDESTALPDEQSHANLVPKQSGPYVSPPLEVLAVMTANAMQTTQKHINTLGLACHLRHLELGAALATSLLLNPAQERPALIILDARTSRADRMLTLRALKGHARLRSIPVIWLVSPGDDTMQAYSLAANSVVVVPDQPNAFVQVIEQLCRYWLVVVQLPPETIVD